MPTYVGIDIGSVSVKCAAIRTAYRKTQLVGVSTVTLGANPDIAQAVNEAVRGVLGERTGEGMATALPGSKAVVHTVEVPTTAIKQLREVLPFEIDSQIPFDLDTAVFDYHVLSGATREMTHVLVAVARIDDVKERIAWVTSGTGHEPERIDVGGASIANILPFVLPSSLADTIVVIDLGSETSDVVFIHNGEVAFSRTISFGTKGLPETAGRLARELRLTMSAFRASQGLEVKQIYLCGGGSFSNRADQFLASELDLPVAVLPEPQIELFPGVTIGHSLAAHAKALGLALGLAERSRGMNLRQGELSYERGYAWVRDRIPLLAGLAAAILVSFVFSAWAQLYAKGKEQETLGKALAIVSKEVLGEETGDAARAQELLSKLTTIADEDPLPHADAFDVLVKISEAIPASMVHDIEEFDFQKGHAILHGLVGSTKDAEAIAATLKTDVCFSDVKITRTTAAVTGGNQKYILEFDLKCPEDQKANKKKDPAAATSAAAAPSSTGGNK